MATAWCKRAIPKVGDRVRCRPEGLQETSVLGVVTPREFGSRATIECSVNGTIVAEQWALFRCCEVLVEVPE